MKDKKRFLSHLLILALCVVLLISAISAVSYAKYRKQILMTGKLTVKNRLAEGFTLQEYVLTRNADGSYSRNGSETTAEPQSYQLLPGLSIPQAPFLSIDGKSEVPAVLYLELLPMDGVSFTLTQDWTLLNGVVGYKGGDVYVYQNGAALTNQSPALSQIEILTDGFLVEQASGSGSVKMIGYLLQAGEAYQPDAADALFQQRLNGN